VGESALDVRLKPATGEPWILANHRLLLVQKQELSVDVRKISRDG
jgi:hypothetical protein